MNLQDIHEPVLLIIAMIAAGCADARDSADRRAHATIDTLDGGAVVVSNSESGLWASPRALVETTRIGSIAGDGPDVLGEIGAVGLGPDGRIYVYESQAGEIRIFTRDGQHVRTIGRPGGGPGELGRLSGISWDGEGRLWAVDIANARYSLFAATGDYLESAARNLAGILPWIGAFDDAGRLYDASAGINADGMIEFVYYAFDRSLTPVDTFPPLSYPLPARRAPMAAMRLIPRLTFALDPAGFIWFGMKDEYRIVKRTLEGDTVRIATLPRSPATVTAALRDSILEAARASGFPPDEFGARDIPNRMVLFERIVVDDRGRPMVLAIAEDGTQVLDFFDEDGRYLGTVRPPAELAALQPPVVRGDTILAVAADEMGAPYVVELRLEQAPG